MATRRSEPSENLPPRIVAIALVAITALAAVLRLQGLTSKSIWLDEAMSVEIARLSWHDFFLILQHQEANMGAYYLLLRAWLLLGDGEAMVRALSVLFSIATVPLLYLLGSRLFGKPVGLLAAWLLAINAYHIRYAQEARSYAMFVFLMVLATWLLVRNLQEKNAHWFAYTAICVLSVYTHLFALLFIAAHMAALLYLRRTPPARYALAFVLAVLPQFIFAVLHGREPVRWVPPLHAGAVLALFTGIAGNGGWLLLGLQAVAVACCAVAAWRAKERYIIAVSWLLLPVLLTLLACVAQPFFVARYLNPCVAGLALLSAAGLGQLKLLPRMALLAAISAACLAGVASYYQQDFDLDRGDWRAASAFVLQRAQAGDDAFYPTFSGMPLEYYKELRHFAYPASIASRGNLPYTAFLRTSIAEEISNGRTVGPRVWLLLDERDGSRINLMMRSYFGRGKQVLEKVSFGYTTVLLLSAQGSAASAVPEPRAAGKSGAN